MINSKWGSLHPQGVHLMKYSTQKAGQATTRGVKPGRKTKFGSPEADGGLKNGCCFER
jgi:hypothetical protein